MKLEKIIIGAFGFLAEDGATIDENTVSIDAYPDVDPVENWESIGCITEVTFETEKETDTDYCPDPNGGYAKVDTERVVRDIIKFKTKQAGEPFWRMQFGLKDKIVNATAQTPFASKDRSIKFWFKCQGRAEDGADRVVMNVFGELSIDETPKWSKDPTKPGYKFEVINSSIATVEPDGIV